MIMEVFKTHTLSSSLCLILVWKNCLNKNETESSIQSRFFFLFDWFHSLCFNNVVLIAYENTCVNFTKPDQGSGRF
jgi:hypothetical protein